jgi:hypothetical protein
MAWRPGEVEPDMTNPWETNNCAAMKAHYAVYSIPQAAALWCDVPEDQVPRIVREAEPLSHSGLGRSIWTHPSVPCLEPRSRAIAEAIEMGELPHGREDGETVADNDHVAYERRHFFGFSCTSSGWNYPPILIFGKERSLWIHPVLLGRSRRTTLIIPPASNKSSRRLALDGRKRRA